MPVVQRPCIRIAKKQNARAISFNDLADRYGASDFATALAVFAAKIRFPNATRNQLRNAANQIHVPWYNVATFFNVKLSHPSLDPFDNSSDATEIVHVRPEHPDSHSRVVADRFDTVLVGTSDVLAGACYN